ncbi:glycosyltransferase [Trypanosoma conorhini]|uniref:Glycosyltransferase n=1 Tax=Trypanosoma conorhini TaxID=83891 RepID=A0A3R7KW71_9TRYP|nr:glycosyltransferase [Trypanosoma conorhini]RNF14624.1 glycosyltransferase [Trypanosoma conorhini]
MAIGCRVKKCWALKVSTRGRLLGLFGLFGLCTILSLCTFFVSTPAAEEWTRGILRGGSLGPFPTQLLQRGPGGGTILRARPRSGEPVLQLSHLGNFCAAYAPELTRNPPSRNYLTTLPRTSAKNNESRLPPYPLIAKPVCFRHDVLYIEGDCCQKTRKSAESSFFLRPHWSHLTNAVLRDMQNDASITSIAFVPAIGIIPLNRHSIGQLYHEINDLVKEVMSIMTEVDVTTSTWKYSEIGKLPTQFLIIPHRRLLWPRAVMRSALPVTARFLGAFGYPTAPSRYFFDDAPVLYNNTVYCTCQAILAGEVPSDGTFQQKSVAVRLAADMLLRYFNETPYESKQDVVADTETATAVPLPILRRLSHVRHIARRFWTSELEAMGESSNNESSEVPAHPPVYRPRLLLINRKHRGIYNYTAVVAVAERVGFNVQVVYLERMSLEEQFHVGRHADVMMGLHGMGLTHVLWMDGRRRNRCRALLELMPFGCPQKLLHFYKSYSDYVGVWYENIEAVDMYLAGTKNSARSAKREKLELDAVKEQLRSCAFNYRYRGFVDQIAVYNMSVVESRLMAAFARLKKCGVD